MHCPGDLVLTSSEIKGHFFLPVPCFSTAVVKRLISSRVHGVFCGANPFSAAVFAFVAHVFRFLFSDAACDAAHG